MKNLVATIKANKSTIIKRTLLVTATAITTLVVMGYLANRDENALEITGLIAE